MSRNQFAALISIILFAVLVLTNPKEDEHKAVVKNKFTTLLQRGLKETTESNNLYSTIGEGLGLLFGSYFVDKLIDNVSRKNYFIFSTTTISWEGKMETIGAGILGNVFLFSQFEKALDRILEDKRSKPSSINESESISEKIHKPLEDGASASSHQENANDFEKPTAADNQTDRPITGSNTQYQPGNYVVGGYANDRVYFHNSPDETTKRDAYLIGNQEVYVQKIENGFGYVEYTDDSAHTSKGWIKMQFLVLGTSN